MAYKNGYIYLPPVGHRATARQLAKLSGYQLISFENTKECRIKYDSLVINWGNSTFPRALQPKPSRILNSPAQLAKGINKLEAFKVFNAAGIPCPEWTIDSDVAKGWFNDNHVVYTRTLLCSSGGEGIQVQAPKADQRTTFLDLATAKIHTKRFTGKQEFRIHVFNEEVLHIQQKKRKAGMVEDPEDGFFIKNLENGYIFAIQDIECPKNICDAAVQAVAAVGMDFGAVDVGYKVKSGEFCVFEINSRPALSGTTLVKYSEALKSLI